MMLTTGCCSYRPNRRRTRASCSKSGGQLPLLNMVEEHNTKLGVALRERRRIAEQLRRSQERYRALVETAFAGISMTDSDERLTFVNHGLCEMLGYEADDSPIPRSSSAIHSTRSAVRRGCATTTKRSYTTKTVPRSIP